MTVDKTAALALLDKGVLCQPYVCRNRERACDCTDMAAYIRSLSAEVSAWKLRTERAEDALRIAANRRPTVSGREK